MFYLYCTKNKIGTGTGTRRAVDPQSFIADPDPAELGKRERFRVFASSRMRRKGILLTQWAKTQTVMKKTRGCTDAKFRVF